MKAAEFRPEKVRLTTRERIDLRGLFATVGLTTKSGEEELRAPPFLDALAALAGRAGGDPPLPPHPHTLQIEELRRLSGTEQLGAILEQRTSLEEEIGHWKELAERASSRSPSWDLASGLRRHAASIARAEDILPEFTAIQAQRSLLAETDHLAPLVAKLAAVLRQALTTLRDELSVAVDAANATLASDATWAKLDVPTQDAIRKEVGLDAPPALLIDTDIALRRTLDERPLPTWHSDIDAVEGRIANALGRGGCAPWSRTTRIVLALR